MTKLQVFCDGGARGNPGPAASAFVVLDESEEEVYSEGFYLGETTNNQAEYQAVINAVDWLNNNQQGSSVTFFLDSQLVVNQIKGLFKVKEIKLQEKRRELQLLIDRKNIEIFDIIYVPREKNYRADKLVNITLDNMHIKKSP